MEVDALEQWRSDGNWRAHVARYSELKKESRSNYSPEQYCEKEEIDCEGFKLWLEYLEKEDSYAFYRSVADQYLDRAKGSLKLLKEYINIPELQMPLMRDAIVAYAVAFRSSCGRVSNKRFRLKEIESLIPKSLRKIHDKICDHRDKLVAHCDLKPRNPRVGSVGGLHGISIGTKGYTWRDYRKLIPEFEKLISAVQEELQKYNREKFSFETYFRDSLNSPTCVDKDPGPPSEKI